MDDVVTVLKDLQPAAIVVALVALAAVVSNRLDPRVGPWVSLVALGGVTVFVCSRVIGVDEQPSWLIPLAAAGLLAATAAGYRLWRAAHAVSNNDRTVGYVFPTAVAILALWLSIALIEFDATRLAAAG